MPHYVTRLSYNSANWRHPTADAKCQETGDTYNRVHGFGHEDWLFRNEWSTDGWRYGFVQGVGRSHDKLVKAAEAFDLTLFTIPREGPRRYVATIRDAEVLSDEQADRALAEFRRRGWISAMLDEIRDIGGNAGALGDAKWARHILNLRFRWENLTLADAREVVGEGDPVRQLQRYNLCAAEPLEKKHREEWTRRNGSTTPPPYVPYFRRSQAPVFCSPEHALMQAVLMKELETEYPGEVLLAEQDFIDVSVRTKTELLLFELKSDLEPRAVIRQALGQILEYAYHPSRRHDLPLKLFIVGRKAPTPDDLAYLAHLNEVFALPVQYRTVNI